MTLRRILAALALACVLSACGSGPVKRISPSTVAIQELVVKPDGQWRATLRVQNFSTMSMHYDALHANVRIAGTDVGEIELKPDLDIPGNSADVVDATLHATAKLPAGDIEYQIKGTIETSEPKANFKFDRTSRLSPAPGLAGTYR